MMKTTDVETKIPVAKLKHPKFGEVEMVNSTRKKIEAYYLEHNDKPSTGNKDDCALIYGEFEDNKRNAKSIRSRYDLTIDIDDRNYSRKRIEDALISLNYRAIAHSTHSSLKNKRKWRICFLADKPFKFDGSDAAIEKWKDLYVAFAEKLGIKYDNACKDPARIFYAPCIPNEDSHHEAFRAGHKILDFDDIEIPEIPEPLPQPIGIATVDGDFVDVYEGDPLADHETFKPHVKTSTGVQGSVGKPLTKKEKEAVRAAEKAANIVLDQEGDIEKAIQYAKVCDPAIQGHKGDNTTYTTACKIKEFGISQQKNFDILKEHFNHRCVPPWEPDELKTKVLSAYKNAQNQTGILSSEVIRKKFDDGIDLTPDTKPRKLIKFKTFKELTEGSVRPDWVIKNYLEKNTINLFYGESGVYKSFLAMDIGVHIAAGKQWIGKKSMSGSVIYIAGEGHGGIRRRLKGLRKHLKLDKRDIPFSVSPCSVQIDNMDNTVDLIDAIKASETPKPVMIIIDTLATASGVLDENQTSDMNQLLSHVRLIQETFNCSILLVHHVGHSEKERPRGAYSLIAGVDSSYQITKDESMVCLHTPRKMKDGTPPPDTWLSAKIVVVDTDEDGEPVDTVVLEPDPGYTPAPPERRWGPNQGTLLTVLAEQDKPVEFKNLMNLYKEKIIASGRKFNNQGFKSALKSVADCGRVIHGEDNMVSLVRRKAQDCDPLMPSDGF